MRFKFENLKADLTGKWAFEPAGLFVFTPLYFIFSVLLGTKFSEPFTAVLAAISNVVSLSACAAVFALYYFTVFRNRLTKPVHIAWVVIAGASLGFTKGLITGLMMFCLGVEDDFWHAITSRVLSTTILGIVVLLTQPILLSFRERFRHQRDTLVAERVKLASTPQAELIEFAAQAREQMNKSDDEKPGFLRSSELLRRIIQDDLRPLSHRIWEQENARYTDFTLSDLYRLSVTKYALPWVYVSAIYFVTAYGAFASKRGPGIALGMDLLMVSSIIACYNFAQFYSPKKTLTATIYALLVVSVASYLGGTASILVFDLRLDGDYLISMVANALWILELTLSGAVFMAAVKSHQEIVHELIRLVGADEARKDSELLGSRLANRELAQYLHGHLQNQLLAAALRIEAAEASNNKAVLQQELDAIDDVLASAPEGYREAKSTSLSDEVFSIQRLWDGLLAVELEVDQACAKLNLSPNLIHDLTQAANEAITNSLRHGFASEVKVNFRARNGMIEMTAVDNGTGPRNGGLGLGSALFKSLAGSKWSLTPGVGGGSVLQLKVRA